MVRKLLLLAYVTLLACHREQPPERPPVVLISIDTLRSDHLPAYGYRGVATPNIDALANDGIVFEHAFSQVPLTLPSHVSILTGLLPAHHGVRDNAGFVLDPKTPTIASMLRARGYVTEGAVSAYVLRGSTNIGTGFDDYDSDIPFIEGAPTGNLARPGLATAAIAKAWITSHADSPFFSFVHLFDPHAPYEPTYDADIAAADRAVGVVLDALRTAGVYDRALIVLVSDHGEGLRDHGEQEHGVLLYREALQVPLVVKLPANDRRGTRVARPVQSIDVFPTIAAITGAASPTVDGRSLLIDAPPVAIYAETWYPRIHLGWSELRSVIEWPHHLIDGPKPELYDVARDPREKRELQATNRRAYTKLRADVAASAAAAPAAPNIDPEEAKKLAALGYVSAQPMRGKSDLNPRDHLQDLDALKEVTELMSSREFSEAAARIEELLARNPGWSDLRNNLGIAYEELGDLPRAEKTYRDAIAATPELAPDFALLLANVLLQRGAIDDAEAHARLALKTNPNGAHELLANVALARHDLDGAMGEAKLANSDFLIARVAMARNDPQTALAALQRVYARHTTLPRGYFALAGDVFTRLGRTEEARLAYEQAKALRSRRQP